MSERSENLESVTERELSSPRLGPGVFRAAAHDYDRSLDVTLRGAVVPYGYTVSIWASGAYLIDLQGLPGLLEAFAFVAGAILAFSTLASIVHHRHRVRANRGQPAELHPETSHPIFAAGLHIAAVGLALCGAWLIDQTLGSAAWLVTPFSVTFIYLSIASAELAVAVELRRREIGMEHARAIVAHRRRVLWGSIRRSGE